MQNITLQRQLDTQEKDLEKTTQQLHQLRQQHEKLLQESNQDKETLEVQSRYLEGLEQALQQPCYNNEGAQPNETTSSKYHVQEPIFTYTCGGFDEKLPFDHHQNSRSSYTSFPTSELRTTTALSSGIDEQHTVVDERQNLEATSRKRDGTADGERRRKKQK